MTETAQTERTYEKREITPDKPILFRVVGIKTSAPVKNPHTGKETTMVNFILAVDDQKYPQFDSDQTMHRVNAWCAAGTDGRRGTKSYEFLETVLGEAGAVGYDRMDLAKILEPTPEGGKARVQQPADLLELWGRYVVGWMKPAEQDDQGRWWQNPKEFKHPDDMEWDVEERRMDQGTMRKYIGLPKAKTATAAQTPSQPAVEPKKPESLKFLRTFGTRKENTILLKGFCDKHPDYTKLKDAYLAIHGVKLVSELPTDDDVKHLLVLFWLEERRGHGGRMSSTINEQMMRRHKKLHEFTAEEAIFLLTEVDHIACEPEPF